MTGVYKTYGAALTNEGLVLYCYNDNITNIIEIVNLENQAFYEAFSKRHKLFDVYPPQFTDYGSLIEVSRN